MSHGMALILIDSTKTSSYLFIADVMINEVPLDIVLLCSVSNSFKLSMKDLEFFTKNTLKQLKNSIFIIYNGEPEFLECPQLLNMLYYQGERDES